MVVRFWSAHTTALRFPDYLTHFNKHVLPRLRDVEGFLEARILSQNDGVVVLIPPDFRVAGRRGFRGIRDAGSVRIFRWTRQFWRPF